MQVSELIEMLEELEPNEDVALEFVDDADTIVGLPTFELECAEDDDDEDTVILRVTEAEEIEG